MRLAMLFVKDLPRMAAFYSEVLGLPLKSQSETWVEFEGFALHAIPAAIAAEIEILSPPAAREEMPFKPVFEVEDVAAEIERLDRERSAAIAWGQAKETELLGELDASRAEYAKCLAVFQQAEVTIEERTMWAQSLQSEIGNLTAQLASIRASKWLRLGRSIGIGPKVE